jgi:hypothetical protein
MHALPSQKGLAALQLVLLSLPRVPLLSGVSPCLAALQLVLLSQPRVPLLSGVSPCPRLEAPGGVSPCPGLEAPSQGGVSPCPGLEDPGGVSPCPGLEAPSGVSPCPRLEAPSGVSPCPGFRVTGVSPAGPPLPAPCSGPPSWAGVGVSPCGLNLAGHLLKSTVTSNIVTGHCQWQCLFSRTESAYFCFIAAEHRNYNCFFSTNAFRVEIAFESAVSCPSHPFRSCLTRIK